MTMKCASRTPVASVSASQFIVTSRPAATPPASRSRKLAEGRNAWLVTLFFQSSTGIGVEPQFSRYASLRTRRNSSSVASDHGSIRGSADGPTPRSVLHALEVAERGESGGTEQIGQAGDVLRLVDVDREPERRAVQRVQDAGRLDARPHQPGADALAPVRGVDAAVEGDAVGLGGGRPVLDLHEADHHVAVEGREAAAFQVRVRVDQFGEGVLGRVVLADLVDGLDGVEEVG